MGVQIQGRIKKDHQEYVGLDGVLDIGELKPGDRVTAVVEFEAVAYTVDLAKGGESSVKVRIVRAEPLEDELLEQARALLDKAYTDRTGQAAPPPTLFDQGVPDDDDGDEDDGKPWPGDAPSAEFSEKT